MSDLLEGVYLEGCLDDASGTQAPGLQVQAAAHLPDRVDLRGMCSPVEDQGRVGSCTANATVGALEYHLRMMKLPFTDLSRLFVYYNARVMDGREGEMHGSSMVLNMAATMMYGACPASMWPYQTSLVTTRPTEACYRAAENLKGVSYARLEHGDPVRIKSVLAQGLPVPFAMQMPREGYAMGYGGRITRPAGGWWPRKKEGGHALLMVGYDDAMESWLVRNSWGTRYGEQGYFWLHYEALEAYKKPDNFWVIGALDGKPGLQLVGPSVSDHIAEVRARLGQNLRQLDALKQAVSQDLGAGLDARRQSIRDRLRGPGAGGGY